MNDVYIIIHEPGIDLSGFIEDAFGHEKVKELHFQQGDVLEVTNHARFIGNSGWFVLIKVSNQPRRPYRFVSLDDLERYMEQKHIMSMADALIKFNVWHYQLNEALDRRDKDWFRFLSRKLVKLKSIL